MKEHHLGGWLAWSINHDDWSGSFCGDGKFPLLRAMNKALGRKHVIFPFNKNVVARRR